MNVDKSDLKRVISGWTAFPAWSPDGQSIAFQGWVDTNYEIFICDADGNNLRRMTNDSGFDGQPAWSPDGKKIAFSSNRSGDYAIYTMNADGSNLKKLNDYPLSLHPKWSPDGQYIGFDADSDGDGWQELALMKSNGSDQQTIHNPGTSATAWAGSWSPDSNYLGFTDITLTQQGGEWIWLKGEIKQWDMDSENVMSLVPGITDWYMDWQTLDTIPPVSSISQLPAYSRADQFSLKWSGSDLGGSGIKNYSVYYRSSSIGTWQTFWANTIATEAQFDGIPGETVDFLVRARDNAFNVGPWLEQPVETTTFYRTELSGYIVDNRGVPLEGVPLNLNPTPMFDIETNQMGKYAGYTAAPGVYTIDINQTGFAPIPTTNTTAGEDFKRTITLLPPDSQLSNGTFEASGFLPVGWQTAGGLIVAITGQDQATGKYSAQMGSAVANSAQASNAIEVGELSQEVTISPALQAPTLSLMAKANGDTGGDGSGLEVIVLPDGGSEVVVLSPVLGETWAHYWADLTSWQGQKVEIIIRTIQDSNDPPLTVYVDDISLGSASPELWVDMSSTPPSAIMGEFVTINIEYGNQGAVAAADGKLDVALDHSLSLVYAIPPAIQNGFDLSWNLPPIPANSGPQMILVRAFVAGKPAQAMKVTADISSTTTEAHTANNETDLYIGHLKQMLMPVIARWPN